MERSTRIAIVAALVAVAALSLVAALGTSDLIEASNGSARAPAVAERLAMLSTSLDRARSACAATVSRAREHVSCVQKSDLIEADRQQRIEAWSAVVRRQIELYDLLKQVPARLVPKGGNLPGAAPPLRDNMASVAGPAVYSLGGLHPHPERRMADRKLELGHSNGVPVAMMAAATQIPVSAPVVPEVFIRADHILHRAGKNDHGQTAGENGLRLGISKRTIEADGGHIAADSPPRRGSAFRSPIPAIDDMTAVVQETRVAQAARSSCREGT